MLKALYSALVIVYLSVPATAREILLVRGTASTPNEAERAYAAQVAANLARWLEEMDVPHRTVDDEEVTAAALRGTRIAILTYNPNPARAQLEALRSFTAGGGSLIVFFSASPELASLMGLRLGPHMASDRAGRWSLIRFNGKAPPHMPETVRQESWNIRPVRPAGPGSAVIAHWESPDGKSAAEPAWVRSPHGFWMTHVLLDDGDIWNKKRMLLALLATHDPSVWRPAAARYVQEVSRLGGSGGFPAAVRKIRQAAAQSTRGPLIDTLLAQAQPAHDRLLTLLRKEKYASVIEESSVLRSALFRAYAVAQRPRENEFRGVWDHSGTGLFPGDWGRTCRLLAATGMTDIMVNVVWPGEALYDSDLLPESDTYRRHGDQLAQCIKAAHPRGLRVHVWKVCWKLDNASDSLRAELRKQGRLQVSDTGQILPWLCPSHPENVKMEKDPIREIVRRYDVDGIHLDYIRYRDAHTCFCDRCRISFQESSGHRITDWPTEARSGRLKDEFSRWRCSQITRLVRDVRALVTRIKPGTRVSAAVYGHYPSCTRSIGQDWLAWLKASYVDFVCPMNYTSDNRRFDQLVRAQLGIVPSPDHLVPGIGVTASNSHLEAVDVIDQIRLLRKAGAAGFMLFDLDRTLVEEVLPVLRLGITAEP